MSKVSIDRRELRRIRERLQAIEQKLAGLIKKQ